MIKNLVFEGGGVLGTSYVGALDVLHANNYIQNCTNFAGTSAGAITAFLLAIKMDMKELRKFVDTLNYCSLEDTKYGIIGEAFRLLKYFGLFQGDMLCKILGNVLTYKKLSSNVTFQQLYEQTGNTLSVVGTNLSKGTSVIFCKETTPNMSIVTAVRISMSIPFFFKSMKYDNDFWGDGCLLNNYPLDIFDNEYKPEETLGFRLITSREYERTWYIPPIRNIFSYTTAVFDTIYNNAQKCHLSDIDWKRTIQIDTGKINATDFHLNEDEKNWLIQQGKFAALQWMKKKGD